MQVGFRDVSRAEIFDSGCTCLPTDPCVGTKCPPKIGSIYGIFGILATSSFVTPLDERLWPTWFGSR